jgi:hypothetical protein
MQKVYLLLRNNRQSGPYTIDQLWQQQLRPTDMVWIEGQSTAWSYVSELELKPSISSTAGTSSIPQRDEIERKAEELRRRALVAPAPGTTISTQPVAVKRRKEQDEETEEETIDFIDHRKEKKNIFGEVVMTLFIIAFLAGGIYSSQTFFKGQKSMAVPAITKISSDDRHDAAVVIHEDPAHDSVAAQKVSSIDTSISSTDSFAITAAAKPKATAVKHHMVKDTTTARVTPVMPIPLGNTEATVENAEKPLPDSANKDVVVESKPPVVSDQPEKKKGFLKGIFRKKKKGEENNGSQQNQ